MHNSAKDGAMWPGLLITAAVSIQQAPPPAWTWPPAPVTTALADCWLGPLCAEPSRLPALQAFALDAPSADESGPAQTAPPGTSAEVVRPALYFSPACDTPESPRPPRVDAIVDCWIHPSAASGMRPASAVSSGTIDLSASN